MTSAALRPAALFGILKDAALAFSQDKAPRLAAAVSYYAMFSLAPILFLAVVLIGRFLSDNTVMNELFSPNGMLVQSLGAQGAEALRSLIPKDDVLKQGMTWAGVIGFGTLFMGATGLFVQVQDALNSMWGADPAPPQGIANMVKTRLISFAMILVIGVLLLGFLVLNTYLAAIAERLGAQIGLGAVAVRVASFVLSTLFLTPVFGAIYKLLPAVKLQWREVIIGGAITALLFTIGQILIGLYFGRATTSSALGAAGTLLALLTWIYYSTMIFFFGAEVTWVYSQRHGSHAGGAANLAKKEALAAQGVQISTLPSEQEAMAAAAASKPPRDARGRVVGRRGLSGLAAAKLGQLRPPRRTPTLLPSLGAALWNAVSAILAIPAVLILGLFGLGKKK